MPHETMIEVCDYSKVHIRLLVTDEHVNFAYSSTLSNSARDEPRYSQFIHRETTWNWWYSSIPTDILAVLNLSLEGVKGSSMM